MGLYETYKYEGNCRYYDLEHRQPPNSTPVTFLREILISYCMTFPLCVSFTSQSQFVCPNRAQINNEEGIPM